MKSRMEKYYDSNVLVASRSERNADLYKDTTKNDLEDFNVNSNVKVLGGNSNNIDIDKVKEILDKKYQETPKRKSIALDLENEQNNSLNLEETREYNITTILERAKEQKEEDYEQERLKKIRDTQYDILKNLDIKDSSIEIDKKETEDELLELIHTITEKELTKKEVNPLDILEDLKGSENTLVLDGLKEDIDVYTSALRLMEENNEENRQIIEETIETKTQAVKDELEKNEIDKSFFTNPMSFSQSDFDDFNDLKEEVKSSKILIRVLIIIVIIAIIIGFFLVFNNVLGLGII